MGLDRLFDHEIKGTAVLFLFWACVQKSMLCANLHKNTYWLLPSFDESKHVLQLKTYLN